MRIFWLVLLGGITVKTFNLEEKNTRIHGENGWYVPLANGSSKWMDKATAEFLLESMNFIQDLSNPVEFFLYTNSSPDPELGEQITANTTTIENSSFNPAHPTRVLIHGWLNTHNEYIFRDFRNTWLRLGPYNVIVVDWHHARSGFYWKSVLAVPGVGKQLAGLIDFLSQNYNMSLDTLHLIGHSLGAHVSGHAGKHVKSGQIHTIVGLDPALPLFSYDKPEERLHSGDAFYVESVHTNSGQLGFKKPVGKASFYINGGEHQPECPLDLIGACSHIKALTYYIEAISAFAAASCEDYNQAISKNCSGNYGLVRLSGNLNAYEANGSYYVPTQ